MSDELDILNLAHQVLQLLESRRRHRTPGDPPNAITASEIARRLAISPDRSNETRRRAVRRIIRHLRDELGVGVLTEGAGYYLPAEPGDLRRAEDYAQRTGLEHLRNRQQLHHSDERHQLAGQAALFPEAAGSRYTNNPGPPR